MKTATSIVLFALTAFSLLGCGGKVDEISPKDIAAIRKSPNVESASGDWPWWRGPSRDTSTGDATVKRNSLQSKVDTAGGVV